LQFDKHDVEGLLSAVEDLFLRLSGVNFSVEVEDVRAKAAAAGVSVAALTGPDDDDQVEPIRGIALEVETELEVVHPIGESGNDAPDSSQAADEPTAAAEEQPSRGIAPGSVDAAPQRRIS
jgi:hypothetical protein